MKQRALVCGDREWKDYWLIFQTLQEMQDSIECVIEGECRGADRMARVAATWLGIPWIAFPARWDKFEKAAGPIRNEQMLRIGRASIVLAFHNDLRRSVGTANMIKQASRAHVDILVYKSSKNLRQSTVVLPRSLKIPVLSSHPFLASVSGIAESNLVSQ